MKAIRQQSPIDLLGMVSVMCMVAFVGILCFVAASDPAGRQLLTIVITGLGAGGLILFRQLRKAAHSLITSEARAQYAATHDGLTQLPNKALLIDRLRTIAAVAAPERPETFRLLCIGLDRYDEVSEVLGPDESDRVIIEIAARLGSICEKNDILARVGDDIFVWAPTNLAESPAKTAARVVALLSKVYVASSGQAVITCSIGMNSEEPERVDPTEALRQAQIALSSARKRGAAHSGVFEPSMDRALKSRNALEVDLRRDLNAGALTMVYQPQVTAKGALTGVEALMRWTSAEHGEIAPSLFVPLAESCGLSEALGRFALRQAFLDASRWSGLKVAVNVSGAQIRSGGLVAMLKELVAETGANPQDFELEITEGVLLADEADTYDTLNAVRKLGFALSLDDFGTGYSSLSYLRRFPVDKIKIDRSFVSHLGKRPESSAIIQAIVDMADALGLKVIAEGVETADQMRRLTQIGCSHFQGYYYSMPVDAGGIGDLLAGRSKLAA